MIDLGASGLVQLVSFEVLDRQRRSITALDGVSKLTVQRSIYTSPRSGGSIDLTLQQDLDLRRLVVRPWVTLQHNGEEETYAMMTAILQLVTPEKRTSSGARMSLKLLDFTRLLDVPLGEPTTVNPGDNVSERVRAMLSAVGAIDAAITESSATVAAGIYFSAKDTKGKYVNTLLEAIGYGAVWADVLGQLQCHPYTRPSDRPVVADFGFIHGRTCTYNPEFSVEDDILNVPNHAILTSRSSGNDEPLVGEAWLPASHPNSMESRDGLEIPFTESEVDLAQWTTEGEKQAAINVLAMKRLIDKASPTRSFEVSHRWRPTELQIVTPFQAPARGMSPAINTLVSIVADNTQYSAGGTLKTTTTLQEVIQ